MAARKAASVLPEPVGAAMSVGRPALIAAQASVCAGVGAGKVLANHAATAGWNSRSRSPATFSRAARPADRLGREVRAGGRARTAVAGGGMG